MTTVTAGTLQLGSGGNAGSINDTGAVVTGADGILAFNHSDNVVFPAPISGSGGVQQMGPGLLSFGVPASYTGPTVITGGTLQDSNFNQESALTGVVAHYTFNYPVGPISAWQAIPDVSGNGHTMYAYNGGSLGSYVGGGVFGGNALSTGGNLFSTGGHAEGGQVAIPFPTLNTWTVSEWFQVTSAQTSNPSWTTLLGDWAEGGGSSFMSYVGPNTWNTGATGGFGVWLGDGSSWSGPWRREWLGHSLHPHSAVGTISRRPWATVWWTCI